VAGTKSAKEKVRFSSVSVYANAAKQVFQTCKLSTPSKSKYQPQLQVEDACSTNATIFLLSRETNHPNGKMSGIQKKQHRQKKQASNNNLSLFWFLDMPRQKESKAKA
jgi:hypothetical protein